MSHPLITFTLVGLSLFYLQNLVLFPRVHLSPLSLLVFYVGFKHPLPLALSLAVVMGLLEDSYALPPLGLHMFGSLIVVAVARFSRRHFLLQHLGPQVLASLGALSLQGLGLSLILCLIAPKGFPGPDWLVYQSLRILGTTALAPLMFYLLDGLEKIGQRGGWRTDRPGPPGL